MFHVLQEQSVDGIGLVPGKAGQAAAGGGLDHLHQSKQADVEGDSVGGTGGGGGAVSTEDAAAGGGERNAVAVTDPVRAADAGGKLGHETGFAQQVEFKCEEGFFDGRGGKLGQEAMDQVENFGVRIVFLQNEPEQLGGIDRQIECPQIFAQGEIAILEFPVGEEGKFARGIAGEDGMAEVEKIDAAVESAGTGLGSAMGALGDDANDALPARKEGQYLRSFAVFGFSQADAAIRGQGHETIIGGGRRIEILARLSILFAGKTIFCRGLIA